jgi:hypothetical protein
MLLSEPGHTPYDLSFNLFGIPVRVHPGFFVIGLLFGANWIRDPDLNAGVRVLLGIGVIFISILVHELGHVLAYRYPAASCCIGWEASQLPIREIWPGLDNEPAALPAINRSSFHLRDRLRGCC